VEPGLPGMVATFHQIKLLIAKKFRFEITFPHTNHLRL